MQSVLGKLFIGGISWDTDEERLKEYFTGYGEVLEAVIMKDRSTGRARGFGFIVFSDPAVGERVIKEKHIINGRMVEAKKAVPRDDRITVCRTSSSIQSSPGPGCTTKIFVGGLASTVTETDFKSYFEQFGTITDVVAMYDHNTQRPRGFGFITYDSEDAVGTVLLKTFHELNGKMIEVKRAVPKVLSLAPSRGPLGGYNYGLMRNNFLNGYGQGYSLSTVGDYGLRMNRRFSPITSGRSRVAPFGAGYGLGLNFEPGLNPNFGGSANLHGALSYGPGLNPYFIGNINRSSNPVGYDGGNGRSTSFFSSGSMNLNFWENGGINYGTRSTRSSTYVGSGNGSIGGTFANTGVNWDSSPISPQGRAASGNISYGCGNSNNSFTGGGYGRNTAPSGPISSSHAMTNYGYDGALADIYNGGSVYGGPPTWHSTNSKREGFSSFGYGIGNGASDLPVNSAPGYVGGYGVTKRQTNRGIAG